jgi:nitrate/nitrite-specific signal transduction histidine kinase
MTWALGIAVIVLFSLVFGMARYLTLPMVRLTKVAQGVGEGNYDQDFTTLTQDRYPDEIDVLASNFAAMVDKVYQREQKLRQQVEELKIEIDEAKRSNQVSEIVDTDFFRDLQAKASRMRNRRQQGEAAD